MSMTAPYGALRALANALLSAGNTSDVANLRQTSIALSPAQSGAPVFPAILLGACVGVLAADLLPGLGLLAALAIGMGAGMAVTGLPVTSVVLVVLLLGDAATTHMPVVILAVVVALVAEERLSASRLLHLPVRPGEPSGSTT